MPKLHKLLELGEHSRSRGRGGRLVAGPRRPYGAWGLSVQALARIGYDRATTACRNAGGSRDVQA